MIRDQDEMRATFEKLRDENELLHAQVAQLNDHLQSVEVNNRRLELEVGSQPDTRGLVGENERMRDRIIALEEELAQTIATKEVDRSILEEQLHHAEARAEKAELVDEIEDKLREALEEIARLESELVQTRAEAAERDIQWQAEVDALAETYEQLQMELKKRERDIEEMKEGAWLSAELQYMAKKVEDAEIAERKHVGEQKELLDKLEDKDATVALMGATADQAAGAMRALEEELNDEKFTNKDLIREIGILREDVQRAEEEKEKALAAAEKFVERTVESTTADRETLKGALKELGNSLETIRSDKARALAERDDKISECNARIHRLEKDLAASEASAKDLSKQLALAQKMLKASLASSASRFGQTISNYRSGLITSGFRTWVNWHSYSQLESKIGDLEFQLDVIRNKGKMMALKRVMGRWKNQQLYMGWREWHGLWEEAAADRRLNAMLGNMTDAERKRALERLNMILTAWSGETSKYMWANWKTTVKEGKIREHKLKMAARRWYNRHLSMGFQTWSDYCKLSAEEQAQIEINELKWRLNRSLQSWMKDKFLYEARLYSEAQKNRFFQCWKYHTMEVSKTTMRMKLLLGTVKRDKTRVAFQMFQGAVNESRLAASEALDKMLLASAKAKALQKMGRVIAAAKNGAIHAGFRSWIEDRDQWRQKKIDDAHAKELSDAEQAGYDRARAEFEPDLHFLREALRRGRASAFAKYMDIFLTGNKKRGQMYCMGMWRSFTKDKAGRLEEERRRQELQRLKDALAQAEAEATNYREQQAGFERKIRDLEDQLDEVQNTTRTSLKKMQSELEAAKRNEEMARNSAEMEKKHLEQVLKEKKRQLEDKEQEIADKETRHQRAVQRYETRQGELEVEVEQERNSRKENLKRIRDMQYKTEQDINQLREELSKAKASERRAKADNEVDKSVLKEVTANLAHEKAQNATLTTRVTRAEGQRDEVDRKLEKMQAKLAKAEELVRASAAQPSKP
jgi:DNA repair exonuclease SbcCD ATPase subunit